MLQKIREQIQGWFAGVIIAMIALSFVLFGIQSYLQSGHSGTASVATVNGEKITHQQFQEAYHHLLEQSAAAHSMDVENSAALQHLALTHLTNQLALLQAARKMGLVVNADELRSFVLSMPAFQSEGRFSVERFKQLLAANGTRVEQFEDQIRQFLLLDQLQNALQLSAFVPMELAQQDYAVLHQDRSIGYFVISSAPLAAKIQPSVEQVERYYQDHQTEFMLPERVSIAYIQLSPKSLAKGLSFSAAELNQYYEDHKANFPASKSFSAVKPKILAALTQQKTEQLLAEKSEQLSNLTYTNPDNLKIAANTLMLPIQHTGFFDQNATGSGILSDPKVVAAAFSEEVLQQKNNSNPIELKNGSLIVLRVNQHHSAQARPLGQVKTQIVAHIKREQAQEQAYAQAQKIQEALNAGKSQVELARQYHLQWVLKPGISIDDQSLPRPLVQAVFRVNLSKTSEAFMSSLPEGNYAVFKVLSYQPGSYAHLNQREQETWLKQMSAYAGELERRLYEKGIIDQAKIKIKKLS